MSGESISVTPDLVIPAWEIDEQFIRASGPGGQNVNKVSSAVQLRWNVDASSLPAPIKARIRNRYRNRISQEGDLIIDARTHRRQALNRDEARSRLAAMVRACLSPPKRRVPTRPTAGSVRRRLAAKKRRSDLKSTRGAVKRDE